MHLLPIWWPMRLLLAAPPSSAGAPAPPAPLPASSSSGEALQLAERSASSSENSSERLIEVFNGWGSGQFMRTARFRLAEAALPAAQQQQQQQQGRSSGGVGSLLAAAAQRGIQLLRLYAKARPLDLYVADSSSSASREQHSYSADLSQHTGHRGHHD